MSIARHETEVSVRIGSESLEASATVVIAQYPEIEVFAMRSYSSRDGVELRLVTNADRTPEVLKAAGFQCQVQPILLIGPLNRAGWPVPLSLELAEVGIEVLSAYTSHRKRAQHYLVFKTSDDDRAMQVLTTGSASELLASNDSRRDRGTPTVVERSGLFQRALRSFLN